MAMAQPFFSRRWRAWVACSAVPSSGSTSSLLFDIPVHAFARVSTTPDCTCSRFSAGLVNTALLQLHRHPRSLIMTHSCEHYSLVGACSLQG